MPPKFNQVLTAGVLAIAASVATAPAAWATTSPISGATTWLKPCTSYWSYSSNIRYMTASKFVSVKLSSVGPLGVQMFSQSAGTGASGSPRFYPPLNTWQDLSWHANNTGFRLVFTCVNPRTSGSPSTNFSGSVDY